MTNYLPHPSSWRADRSAVMTQRVGESPKALAVSFNSSDCPDIWRLSNGDYVVIGTDVTDDYSNRMPVEAGCGPHEKIVMIPAVSFHSAANAVARSR